MVAFDKNHRGLGRAFGLGGVLLLVALVMGLTWPPPALAGSWSPTGSLSVVRRGHMATLLTNGQVLVAGGWFASSSEIYDPTAKTWSSTTGPMAMARHSHTANLLPNGKVVVAGGVGADPASCELYNPASKTWSGTGSLAPGRFNHTATLLPNGLVLVAGGRTGVLPRFTSCELYNPALGTWSATGSLNEARSHHTATLLPNGQVLVAGGEGDSGTLASAALYSPGSVAPVNLLLLD
jgi:hypothetical protein